MPFTRTGAFLGFCCTLSIAAAPPALVPRLHLTQVIVGKIPNRAFIAKTIR